MHLLIIIPRQSNCTGNHVTAKRFSALLPEFGWNCSLVETASDSPAAIDAALARLRPDALLLLHAYRSGKPWLLSQCPQDMPTSVLMTGTDYNHDLLQSQRAGIIDRVRQRASAVIVQNRLVFQQLSDSCDTLAGKLHLLPPGIRLGTETYPLRASLRLSDRQPLLLLPAGIRPVKGNLELLQLCDRLAEQKLDFRLAFCGPVLDRDYAGQFFAALEQRPWAHYLGEIPKAAMADCMRQADVVINNSLSEGLSNSLVEALSLGRPVLARDITGNRALIQHQHNGLLYADAAQFVHLAQQLLTDAGLRAQLSKPAAGDFSAIRESRTLAEILRQTVSGANGLRNAVGER